MYAKGNHDYDKGGITLKGFHKWDMANPSRIGTENHQELLEKWNEQNKSKNIYSIKANSIL